jgi:predicted MFS family arabinose efflux permease
VVWALVADVVPLYPLYALLFADAGLGDADVSALLAVWSLTGVLAEVPSGALADRFSRRAAMVAAGVLQAAAYVLWTALPGVPAFAAGFVVWALGGALVSGAFEALLHDGLAAAGAADRFGRVYGWVSAGELLSQLPTALLAAVLYAVGGFPLVGWASVACCLVAAALAARLPEAPRPCAPDPDDEGWWAVLRSGVSEAVHRPAVRTAVLAVVLLGGLDAVEEYFPLLARNWGVPVALIPLAVLGIPLAGAAGAALGGRAATWRPRTPAVVLACSGAALVVAALLATAPGLLAVAVGYALYRLVLVVAESRLQAAIAGPARATVTSVSGVGVELAALVVFAGYALGGLAAVAVLSLPLAAALPRLLTPRA